VGSRDAGIPSVIAIRSVLAGSIAKSLRKEGMVSAAMYGRASTFKISCSVTADLIRADHSSERREKVGS
jgi:ribosomal protein L25 (general stress protein Ctc)